MKNTINYFGFITLIAIIGFLALSCENGTTETKGTFQIKITGISESEMNIIESSIFSCFLTNLNQTGGNPIAGFNSPPDVFETGGNDNDQLKIIDYNSIFQ